MTELYQMPKYVKPSGATIALDLLATATTSTGSLTGGVYHIANSVWCHFSLDTAYKNVTFKVTPVAGLVYTMTVLTTTLTTAALGASPTIGDLVTALQADADYAAAPFVMTAEGTDTIRLVFKTYGYYAQVPTLEDDVPTSYTATTHSSGAPVAAVTDGMFAAGERQIVVPNDARISVVKATGQSDGIIRVTLCE
jgi:hypothetical protein